MSSKDDDNLHAPPSSRPDPPALSGGMGPPVHPSFAGPQRVTQAHHTSNAPYNLPTRPPPQRSFPPLISHPENSDRPHPPTHLIHSGDSRGSSHPATPYHGLNDSQLEKLESIKDFDGLVALFKRILEQLGAPHCNHEAVVAALRRAQDLQPRPRPFALLTKKDFKVLNPALRGVVLVNKDVIANEILSIPDRFYEELQRCRSTFDRSVKQGCKTVVARYFEWAVHLARVKFEMPRLVVFQEEEVDVTNIPGVGEVNGPLDFITGIAAGNAPMDFLMHSRDATIVSLASPGFVTVEARRAETISDTSSHAQLLAQIKALQIQSGDRTSRTGALSDGCRWSFWHLEDDGWYQCEVYDTMDRKNAERVLAMLTHLVAGKYPTRNPEDMLYLS